MVVVGGFGAVLGIVCPQPAITTRLVEALTERTSLRRLDSDAVVDASIRLGPSESGSGGYFAELPLDVGEVRTLFASTSDLLVDQVVGAIHHSIALHARDVTFVHAGCVAFGDTVVVLPGTSFAGKSTLVRELLAQGARYLSDEFAVITREGQVLPYRKPIAVRPSAVDSVDAINIGADAVRTEGGDRSLVQFIDVPTEQTARPETQYRNTLILVTAYEPDGAWAPRPLTQGEAVLELIKNTVTAQLRPEDMLSSVSTLARAAHCLTTPRGGASSAAREIQHVMKRFTS